MRKTSSLHFPFLFFFCFVFFIVIISSSSSSSSSHALNNSRMSGPWIIHRWRIGGWIDCQKFRSSWMLFVLRTACFGGVFGTCFSIYHLWFDIGLSMRGRTTSYDENVTVQNVFITSYSILKKASNRHQSPRFDRILQPPFCSDYKKFQSFSWNVWKKYHSTQMTDSNSFVKVKVFFLIEFRKWRFGLCSDEFCSKWPFHRHILAVIYL